MKGLFAAFGLCLVMGPVSGCIGGKEDSGVKEPVEGAKETTAKEAGELPEKPGKKVPPTKKVPLPPETCHVLGKIEGEPPLYVPGQNVMVTKLLKPCITRDGRRGFDEDTPWMAMGFPCTAGGGKIAITGHYYNPKGVAFLISTDCPMKPGTMDQVAKTAAEAAGLSPKMRLMAYNSFAVQYWEIPGLPDADTGYTVELQSPAGREGAWKRVRQKEPLRVHLYGRENSWTADDKLYMVEADLRLTSTKSFTLEVITAKLLSEEERLKAKERCQALRPPRDCAEYFH